MKAAHDQRNRAAADVILAAAVIIGYATLTHIYDSKDCSTVLHKCMLLSRKYFYYEKTIASMIKYVSFIDKNELSSVESDGEQKNESIRSSNY